MLINCYIQASNLTSSLFSSFSCFMSFHFSFSFYFLPEDHKKIYKHAYSEIHTMKAIHNFTVNKINN